MGRGRGKGKKQNVIDVREDAGSGEEEEIPAYRRRGRPQKPLKDDIEQEEAIEKLEEDAEDLKSHISSKSVKYQPTIENGRKRKRAAKVKETIDSIKEEKGVETNLSPDDSIKSVGFRQNGSRRKNKPHRAAEAGVE